MAKLKFTIAGPEDPIFNEGVTISSHQQDTFISKARKIAEANNIKLIHHSEISEL